MPQGQKCSQRKILVPFLSKHGLEGNPDRFFPHEEFASGDELLLLPTNDAGRLSNQSPAAISE